MAALTPLAERANVGALGAAPSMPTPASTSVCWESTCIMSSAIERAHTHIHTHTHTHIHTHKHTYTHTYTHTYILTHIHTEFQPGESAQGDHTHTFGGNHSEMSSL